MSNDTQFDSITDNLPKEDGWQIIELLKENDTLLSIVINTVKQNFALSKGKRSCRASPVNITTIHRALERAILQRESLDKIVCEFELWGDSLER